MSAQIITVAQHKGGAGKTTLAAHLAVSWAEARRVALLDTDVQGSLGAWYRQREFVSFKFPQRFAQLASPVTNP